MGNKDQLSEILSLVQLNMPRSLVRTGRQPIPRSLEDMIGAIAEERIVLPEKDSAMVKKAAKAFMEAEVDADAAAALADLYGCIWQREEEPYPALKHEIDAFMRKARSIYVAEIGNLTKDPAYDNIIDKKIFMERMIKAQDTNGSLIARYLQTIETVMDDEVSKKAESTGQWLLLTYKKLIERCKVFLDKKNRKNITDDEIHIAKYIRDQSESEREIIERILSDYKDAPEEFEDITWGEAIERMR